MRGWRRGLSSSATGDTAMPQLLNQSSRSFVLVTRANHMPNFGYTAFETYCSMHAAPSEFGSLQALEIFSI